MSESNMVSKLLSRLRGAPTCARYTGQSGLALLVPLGAKPRGNISQKACPPYGEPSTANHWLTWELSQGYQQSCTAGQSVTTSRPGGHCCDEPGTLEQSASL